MSQPRRPDEIALYARLRALAASRVPASTQPGLRATEQAAREMGIAPRRLGYVLTKWTGKGWWDWGMCPEGGWFTETAPEALQP